MLAGMTLFVVQNVLSCKVICSQLLIQIFKLFSWRKKHMLLMMVLGIQYLTLSCRMGEIYLCRSYKPMFSLVCKIPRKMDVTRLTILHLRNHHIFRVSLVPLTFKLFIFTFC